MRGGEGLERGGRKDGCVHARSWEAWKDRLKSLALPSLGHWEPPGCLGRGTTWSGESGEPSEGTWRRGQAEAGLQAGSQQASSLPISPQPQAAQKVALTGNTAKSGLHLGIPARSAGAR